MSPDSWDVEADVVVVGFGAAGACAALEAAAAGADVLVLDRFEGGGATALSGGVVYAGGGTPQQRAAGVSDSAEAMLGYLSTEVGDVVSPATLREFCSGSVAMLAWLEGHGVPFEGSLCPDKTSYPTNRHYLQVLTLGGLVVAEDTGQVLRPDGGGVAGLYAAGRSAVGLCSRSYVSGLSLADCVLSGRRAGRHAARAAATAKDTARAEQTAQE